MTSPSSVAPPPSLSDLADDLTLTTVTAIPAPPPPPKPGLVLPPPSWWFRLLIAGALSLLVTLGAAGWWMANLLVELAAAVRVHREEERAPVPLPSSADLIDPQRFAAVLEARRPEAVRLQIARAEAFAAANRWADAAESYAAAAGQAPAGLASPAQVAWAEALIRSGAVEEAAAKLARIDGGSLAPGDRSRLHRVVGEVHLERRANDRHADRHGTPAMPAPGP